MHQSKATQLDCCRSTYKSRVRVQQHRHSARSNVCEMNARCNQCQSFKYDTTRALMHASRHVSQADDTPELLENVKAQH